MKDCVADGWVQVSLARLILGPKTRRPDRLQR